MDKKADQIIERVEATRIILDGSGKFPKEVVILEKDESGNIQEKGYRILRKTGKGGFLLN